MVVYQTPKHKNRLKATHEKEELPLSWRETGGCGGLRLKNTPALALVPQDESISEWPVTPAEDAAAREILIGCL